ncbi:Lysine exporter LysO [Vibrio stylophorae]|uniref:Lysine exporter LysO n=1 Tax=Vibrio stylophorae TaxID=659351 RepID=A0ABN8DSK4_9VIBR|nr:lysine exporter LysO family protein [Vibrio stylophorae]CAH0533528.1 Lysine exporter LysO [Vibrio stylophorae]
MFQGMLLIFTPLFVGYFIPLRQEKWQRFVSNLTNRLITLILALIGVSLAALDNLLTNLGQVGLLTLTFFLSIGLFNLMALLWVDWRYPLAVKEQQGDENSLPHAKESLSLLVAVLAGFVVGLATKYWIALPLDWVDQANTVILMVLLLLIGMQLGNSGIGLKQILLNRAGIRLAAVLIMTSWLGGLLAALILSLPWHQGLAMASGFGWYSLSGILIGDHLGPVYGGASFLNELLRELVALISIPLIMRRFPNTAIGYGGATSMDFTLPIIQRCGGIHCVPTAIVSGFILSLSVPFMMLFFLQL